MHTLLQDLRYALRQLRKSPGFAITVVLTLALGIGANTAIFSVMNAVLLRTLPVPNPQQLFYLKDQGPPPDTVSSGNGDESFGLREYRSLRNAHATVADVIAYVPLSFTQTAVRTGSLAQEANAVEVSGNFFSGLGVRMAEGRGFTEADEQHHNAVAVLSYGYWTRGFHRGPNVVGKTIYVNGVPCTIIGVASPHFYGVQSDGSATDLWIPLQNNPALNAWGVPAKARSLYGDPDWWCLMLMVRLRPDVTRAQAVSQMDSLLVHASLDGLKQSTAQNVSLIKKLRLSMIPARGLGTSTDQYQQPLHVLMGMVALVLVIACVNIIMLLLARNAVREREFSLRLALGAGRRALFAQLLAESFLLVSTGTLMGWFFAIEATHLLAAWSGMQISLAPNMAVLWFTLGIAALTALIFGLAPLRAAAGTPVAMVLRSSSTQSTTDRSRVLAGKAMIALQMALCVVLLFGAGLLLRTLWNYQNVNLGLDAAQVLAVGIHPVGEQTSAERLAFYNELTARLRRLPGVQSVTLAENRPGSGWSDNNNAMIDGRAYPANNEDDLLRTNDVGPNFFKTLGIPILAGRGITPADTATAQHIAVVNQTFARHFFHDASPVGHVLGRAKKGFTIVGVARDSKYTAPDEDRMPMAWVSYEQTGPIGNMDVEIRTTASPMSLISSVRRVVHGMDPNAPLYKPVTLQAQFAQDYQMPALFARLAAFFGGLAALLVAIGLYGTLAYRVNRRTAEIGIRMALGADPARILSMILKDSLTLVAAGLILGLPLAWLAAHWMQSMLYQLSPHDPVSLVVAAAGMLLVSVLSAMLPARRAASVDPMQALRSE